MRANPILALGMAAGALALPGVADALGLGRLTVQSSIGQPLSAQIELSAAHQGGARFAGRQGRRSEPLPAEQPRLQQRARARADHPRARHGRALPQDRHPERGQRALPRPDGRSSTGRPAASSATTRSCSIRPASRRRRSSRSPRCARASHRPGRRRSRPLRRRPRPRRPRRSASAPRAAADGDRYQVQRGDTLSKIASEYKPSSVTLEQMLVALFNVEPGRVRRQQHQPAARRRSILTIPSADAAAATAPPEAAQDRPHAGGRLARVPRPGGGHRAGEPRSRPVASAAGTIGAAVVDAAPAAPPGRDQLKVSRDAGPGKQRRRRRPRTWSRAIARSRKRRRASPSSRRR